MDPDATSSNIKVIQRPMHVVCSVDQRPAALISQAAFSNLVTSRRTQRMPHSLAIIPPELLSEIFLICHSLYTPLPGRRSYSALHWEPYTWMALTHVCRHWRIVALATPLLWSTIILAAEKECLRYVPTNPLRVQEFLRRSRDVPLHVSADVLDRSSSLVSAQIVQNLTLIMPYLHRLESLHVSCAMRTSELQTLSGVLHDTPLLRSFTFRCGVYGFASSGDIPLISSTGALSHLERLDIKGFAFVKVMPFFRCTLKHLTMEHDIGDVSLAALLAGIASMPNLESLRIFGISPNPQDTVANNAVLPTVTFPYLQHLGLSGLPSPCAEILSHLCFPASATLEIVTNATAMRSLGHTNNRDIIRVVNTTIAAAIAAKLRGQGIIGSPETPPSYLDISSTSMDFHATPLDTDDSGPFLPDYLRHEASSRKLYLRLDKYDHTACGPLPYYQVALPTTTHIRILTISTPEFSRWEPYLGLFGRVESLRIMATWENNGGCGGLAMLKMPRPTPMFPLLRLLQLEEYEFVDDDRWAGPNYHHTDASTLSNTVEDILESRRNAGIGIRTLVISGAKHMTSIDAAKFERYVEVLEWDCMDSTSSSDSEQSSEYSSTSY